MSNNDRKEAESPDIIEDIIPGKNNSNNQQSLNNKYDLKESAQSVIKDLKEPETGIESSINEERNRTHGYTQATVDTKEKTAYATNEMAGNYLEYQKQVINSFHSVFAPYFESVHNQLLYNQDLFRRTQEMYSTMIGIYAENLIAFGRISTNTVFSNTGVFKNPFNGAE
jgi:hypothetical protein